MIQTGAIALLGNFGRAPIDPPSAGWLGVRADNRLVRESGLWNVSHVQDPVDGAFLDVLEKRLRPRA